MSEYKQIWGDLQALKAQLHEAEHIAQSPKKEVESLTYEAISSDITYSEDMLNQGGMIWILRTGYIKMWDRINKIGEAMIDVLPSELVIESALQAIAQLSSSTTPNNLLLIEQLKGAIDTLRSASKKKCLGSGMAHVKLVSSGPSTHSVDEQQARSTIRQIQYLLHTYRCERWEGLVRARNQLLGAAWLASWLLYALLGVAVLAQVPVETMRQMSVFLLLGAIIGLFGRLLNEVYPNATVTAHMDDYGLTVARIIITPFLSALAALVGVPLAVIALAMVQGHTVDLLNCYDFSTYPWNLLIAAVFGYLPSVLINLLKEQASRIQNELLSSGSTK